MTMTSTNRLRILGLAAMLVWATLPALSAEFRQWTTKAGQTGSGTFSALTPNGEVACSNASGRIFTIPIVKLSTNDLSYLSKQNVLGPLRDWKLRSGRALKAHFTGLFPGGALIVTPDGESGIVAMDRLSDEDITWLELEAPVPLENRIEGKWKGFILLNNSTYHVSVTLSRFGTKWRGSAVLMSQIPASGAQGVSSKHIEAREALAARSTFDVIVTNNVMSWSRYSTTVTARGSGQPATWDLPPFTGTLSAPGLWVGNSPRTNMVGACWLAREPLFRIHPPLTLPKGKVLRMTCSDPRLHYTLYIPKSYDPAVPAPLLINDNPGRNASPLSPKAAEQFGWVMAGLTESGNTGKSSLEWTGNNDAVIFDLMRILNLDTRRFYFSGLSGGARRSAYRGVEFQDYCAGLICIGAGYLYYDDGTYLDPPKTLPIFFIVGQTDMNHDEVVKTMMEPNHKRGRATELIIHPGGHTWGRPEDHEAAIAWLEARWKTAHPKPAR